MLWILRAFIFNSVGVVWNCIFKLISDNIVPKLIQIIYVYFEV